MKKLEGKAALVTGGSRGIGAGIVQRLAREGAHVAFTYAKSPERAAEVVQAAGVRVLAIQADSEIAAMVAYLAGPEAGCITGASLTIAGRFTA